ncbi:MAG: sugar phosphate nucleotidyltransferase, partial [Clostridia bacterium]
YGDGVCDVDVNKMIEFHNQRGQIATMLAYQPGGRFGVLNINENSSITNFEEKSKESGGWINAGYMVLEPEIFNMIQGDSTIFERYPLEECARRNQLNAYCYDGFWQCMDTLRDKMLLEELVAGGKAPWIKW